MYKAVTRRSAFAWFGRRSGLHGWLYGRDLRHRLSRLDLGEPSFSSTHDNLMQRKLAELAHAQAPAYRRCWMISIAAQKLLVDARLLSGHDENRYLLEEGLCHSFSAVLDDDAAIALMTHRRGFVFIEPDDIATVLERLKARRGRLPIHRDLDDLALQRMTADMLERNRKLMLRLESAGAPVLRLKAEAPLSRKVQATRDFLYSLA